MTKYKPESPFYLTPIINDALSYHVDRPIKKTSEDYVIILDAAYEHAPDLLAERIYGKGYDGFWWVIPRRNGLEDPVFDLKAGMTLIVPPKSTVDALK